MQLLGCGINRQTHTALESRRVNEDNITAECPSRLLIQVVFVTWAAAAAAA